VPHVEGNFATTVYIDVSRERTKWLGAAAARCHSVLSSLVGEQPGAASDPIVVKVEMSPVDSLGWHASFH